VRKLAVARLWPPHVDANDARRSASVRSDVVLGALTLGVVGVLVFGRLFAGA
jgi:hypothetical protein